MLMTPLHRLMLPILHVSAKGTVEHETRQSLHKKGWVPTAVQLHRLVITIACC